MTIEEKLRHFLDASLASSKAQSKQIISDYTQELEAEYNDRCASFDRKSKAKLKVEREQIIKQYHHDLAMRQILIKKELGDAYDRLKDQLFEEVRALLDEYRTTDAYLELLVKKFQAAMDFVGDDTEILYLDPNDIALKEQLEARLQRTLVVSEYSFGGGCRTVLEEPQILINDSFDSSFEEKKNEFTWNGGRSK